MVFTIQLLTGYIWNALISYRIVLSANAVMVLFDLIYATVEGTPGCFVFLDSQMHTLHPWTKSLRSHCLASLVEWPGCHLIATTQCLECDSY